jgi:hypothetical protein
MMRGIGIGVMCAALALASILGLATRFSATPKIRQPVGYVIDSKGEWRNSSGASLSAGQPIFEGDLINHSHHSEPDAFIELYLLNGETFSRDCSAAACTTALEIRKSSKHPTTTWYRRLIPFIWSGEKALSLAVYAAYDERKKRAAVPRSPA